MIKKILIYRCVEWRDKNMEFNMNTPAYFKDIYGVDDDVYRYCQNLHDFF